MATTISKHVLEDTTKGSVIKFVGTGGGDSGVLLYANSLAYALNANSYIMTNNTDKKTTYRYQIKRIWGQGQIKDGTSVVLSWANTTDSIVSFGAGQFDYNFDVEGLSSAIPLTTNANGNIMYTSTAQTNDSWTMFLILEKDNRDFDAGQTSDPYAFNRAT